MSERNSFEKDPKLNSPTFDSITTKLSEYCSKEKDKELQRQNPLKYYSKLKTLLGSLCYDIQLFNEQQSQETLSETIDQLIKQTYRIIEDLTRCISKETDSTMLLQLRKLLADFYRNLSIFIPSEKEKARQGYIDVLNACSLQRNSVLYISLILDYSCLLATNYNDKHQAIIYCCKLLIELKKDSNIHLDSASRAYLSFLRRNLILWKKQIGK